MKFMIRLVKIFIRIYQIFISPLLGFRCRYSPTCSEYTSKSIEIYGLKKGIYISLKRVLRCHPWSDGGYDPVDSQAPDKNYFTSNNSSSNKV